ncbi:hypothetical protein HPULCUR_002714 [Helicostylum pulchrum]|uniref:Uncharacterized protein n=1 Tax=Helicostylum pulchrum TaxID=562976 RepID=A0ABP9XT01_9FUNG
MPLQKILAPFLPGSQQRNSKKDEHVVSTEQVLSPTLPFSPPKNNNSQYGGGGGDPVIGLLTVDEDSSSARSNDTSLDNFESKEFDTDEEYTLIVDTYTPNDQNALVLHENPTSFELHDNDVIIETVPEATDDSYFDQDMMRDSASSLAMYQPPHIQAGIDFSPPAEFLAAEEEEEEQAMLTESPVTMGLHSSSLPPKSNRTRTPPPPPPATQGDTVPAEFIQPVQTEPTTQQDIFSSPMLEHPSHFAMETTFRKTDSDFKSKCMKMIRNAKGLVCKPESPKHLERSVSNTAIKLEKTVPHPRTALRPIDTSPVKDLKEEEEASTPIYKRHHTLQRSSTNLPNVAPPAPYKSPVVGTDAYDIKLLCEQSFFGC